MKTGVILKINGSERSALVSYAGANVNESFIIPTHLPTPMVGCTVLLDTDNKVVVSILDYPDSSQLDPFTEGALPAGSQNNSRNPAITKGGDYILKSPKSGYLALLDGFVAIMGGSPLAQIMAIGTKRLIRMVADNIRVEGKDYSFSISEGDNSLPTLNFYLGSLGLEIIGGSEIRFGAGESIKVSITPDLFTLSLLNRDTGVAEPVYRYGYAKFETDENGKKVVKNNFNFTEVIAQMTSLALKIDSAMEISYKKGLTIKGDTLDISTTGGYSTSSNEFSQTITGDGEVKAGNMMYEIGTNGMPGSFQIVNGTLSKIEMDSTGMVKIKGLPAAGIQLGGNMDYAVYANDLIRVLTQIIVTIQSMGTALAPCPITAGAGAAANSIVSVMPMLPMIVNPMVTYGKPLNPKL